MADERDVLAREIDEELRREQLLKLWQAYGIHVIAGVVLIIAGVAGWKFYEARAAAAAQAAGARFAQAVRAPVKADAKPDQATDLDKIAQTGPAGYQTLARLRLAAADRAAGRIPEAIAKYEAVANDRRSDAMLADYARLQAATLAVDSEPWTSLQNRLTPLLVDSNPWRFSARELLGLAALKAGKDVEARQAFEKLLGDGAPPGIAERSRLMMAKLTEAELAKAAAAQRKTTTEGEAPAKADAPKAEPAKQAPKK